MQCAFPLFMTHVQIEKLLQFQEKGGHNKNTHCDKNQKRSSCNYFSYNGHLVIIIVKSYYESWSSVSFSVLNSKSRVQNTSAKILHECPNNNECEEIKV